MELKLIDTLCFEANKFNQISFHNERINRSRWDLFGIKKEINIEDYLQVPSELDGKKVRCRVTYGKDIHHVEYRSYSIKPIFSMKIVNGNHIEYTYKYADRSSLTDLLRQKEDTDDILIIKDGYIRDTSYANIVFLKDGEWLTPMYPLLKGTRREYYLRSGKIKTALIGIENLKDFSEARVINAMISLEESPVIPIENIIL